MKDSPASCDSTVFYSGHFSNGRRHELQVAEVDVGQILKNFRDFRTLDGDQAAVLLKLQGNVEPLTENKTIWALSIVQFTLF